MGQPVVKFAWSLSGNYPVGVNPWNSQPLAVPPAGTYFTPNVKPSAENFNWMFGTIAADLNSLLTWAAVAPGINWRPEFSTSGFTTPLVENCNWDEKDGVWIEATITVAGTPLFEVWVTKGLDDGAAAAWTQIGGNKLTTNGYLFTAVAGDGATAGRYWLAGTDNVGATNNDLVIWFWNGSTWAVTGTGTFAAGASNTWYGVELCPFGGYMVLAVAGHGLASMLISSNDHGATWTGGPGTLPTMAAGSTWLLKSNGTQVLAIPSSVSLYTVYQSTDGHTFTSSAGLGSILAAGNTVVGLAWTADAAGPCWVAAVNNGAGSTFWVRSADGVTWTTQLGGISANLVATDMAGCGSLLVCTLADQSSAGPSGQIWSPDGGVTWYNSQATFTSNDTTATAGYSRSRVRESNQGFLAFNSLWLRFSELGGNPVAKL